MTTRVVLLAKAVILLLLILTKRLTFASISKYRKMFSVLAILYGWAMGYLAMKQMGGQ